MDIFHVLNNSVENRTLKKAVLSKPNDKNIIKTVAKLIVISSQYKLRVEKFTADGKVYHENLDTENGAEYIVKLFDDYRQLDIIDLGGCAVAMRSSKGAVHFKNKIKQVADTVQPEQNNREKNYIFSKGNVYEFLVLLGISSPDGRIYDKKQPKYRQINKFVEIISDCTDSLPEQICVWDLCCGKSYLTFAAYHYLTYTLGKKVTMYGVDLKADVVEYCNSCAEKLGWDGLRFVCGDINRWQCDTAPDMVISLHACDIATDIVLSKAVSSGARIILSSPCCQHELYSTLDTDEFSFITKHPMLKKKLCECATDALRCQLLEAYGYKVKTMEFIDPEDTPKNMLIKAVKTKKRFDEKKKDEYIKNCDMLGVYPTMAKLLLGDKAKEAKNEIE